MDFFVSYLRPAFTTVPTQECNVEKDHFWSRPGEMKEFANTQFVGNLALNAVEYVTNLIKAHCIGKPRNLHTPHTFSILSLNSDKIYNLLIKI